MISNEVNVRQLPMCTSLYSVGPQTYIPTCDSWIGLNNSLTDPGTSTQGVGGPNYNGLPASGGSGTTTTPAQNGSQKFPPPPSSSNNQ